MGLMKMITSDYQRLLFKMQVYFLIEFLLFFLKKKENRSFYPFDQQSQPMVLITILYSLQVPWWLCLELFLSRF